MDGLGDLLQLFAVVLGVQAQVQVSVGLRADAGRLNNVQGAAAGSTGSMVSGQVIGNVVLVLDHLGVHAGQNNAVLQFKPSQLDRSKQCIIAHNTYTLSFYFLYGVWQQTHGKGPAADPGTICQAVSGGTNRLFYTASAENPL